MRGKILTLVAAIVVGAIAAVATFAYLASVRREAVTGNQLTEVLVATRDVPRGATAEELLASGAVERTKVPARYVAKGAFSSLQRVEDRVLAVALSKGEVLTEQRFQFRSEAGLAYTVPKEFVALTVPVNDARGVAGLLKPGDRVAVLATVDTKTSAGDETRIAVPGARVLAVGRTTDTSLPEEQKPKQAGTGLANAQDPGSGQPLVTTVTLALSATDAEKVVLAVESGQIWLALLPSSQSAAPVGPGQTALTVLR